MHPPRIPFLICACVAIACVGCAHSSQKQFLAAVSKGDYESVQEALRRQPGLARARSDDGDTALHLSLEKPHAEVAKILLSNGADANARHATYGDLPIEYHPERVDVVTLLIQHGANRESLDICLIGVEPSLIDPATKRKLLRLLRQAGAGGPPRSPYWPAPLRLGREPAVTHLERERRYARAWNREQGEFMVRVVDRSASAFGISSRRDVRVYDSALNLVRRGMTRAQPITDRSRLVEIRSHAPSVPAALRGEWLFAIAFIHDEVAASRHGLPPRSRWEETMYVDVVMWDGDDRITHSFVNSIELSEFEVRLVETIEEGKRRGRRPSPGR